MPASPAAARDHEISSLAALSAAATERLAQLLTERIGDNVRRLYPDATGVEVSWDHDTGAAAFAAPNFIVAGARVLADCGEIDDETTESAVTAIRDDVRALGAAGGIEHDVIPLGSGESAAMRAATADRLTRLVNDYAEPWATG